MKTVLEFAGVSFAYAGRTLLRDATFTLGQGTATALIGPNGVGKTTLLRIAAGLLRPARGGVSLRGAPLWTLSAKKVARRVALVPQGLELAFPFTVEQVVEQGRTPYAGLLRGMTREDRRAVERAMERADVSGLRRRVFNELSGGERQRVKIALGLAQEAELLLLDEPTQNLDIGRQVELMDLLRGLRTEGMTVLASMHDLHLVQGSFERVLLMSEDEALRSGTAEEMLRPGLLERAFHCPPARYPVPVERKAQSEEKTA